MMSHVKIKYRYYESLSCGFDKKEKRKKVKEKKERKSKNEREYKRRRGLRNDNNPSLLFEPQQKFLY